MHTIRFWLIVLFVVGASAPFEAQAQAADALTLNVPHWALEVLDASFWTQYAWSGRVNPFFQRGDFDGDGQPDLALLVRQKASGKIGIVFVHRATHAVHVVGAGTPFGSGGDDFQWLKVWSVEEGTVLVEVPGHRGEVLYVETPEAAGAVIYWDGTQYQWTQRGE